MKKTYLEIQEADQVVAQVYAKNDKLKNTKFSYAWKKFINKNYIPVSKILQEELEDNRIEYCLTDEKTKEILYNEKGGYKYSKEGLKKLLEVNRKILADYEKKEIEIEPFIVKEEDLPKLTEEEKEQLKGLIL